MRLVFIIAWTVALYLGLGAEVRSQPRIVFSEIHYHPVELPAFNSDGTPVLDLSEDVHEFIELHNPGTNAVSLAGWRLAGGVSYSFPAGTLLQTGQFLVVAKNPARLATVYGLNLATLLGPWSGQLDNGGGTIRLYDNAGAVVEAMSYSSESPWAIGANALGAEDEFTGLNSALYQYRGRSLERVSFAHPANDPANWIASPLETGPSPGRTNAIRLLIPRPVVVSFSVLQVADGQPIVRANQSVRIECVFSSTNALSSIAVEYFVEDINSTSEPRSTVNMTASGNSGEGRFAATLPGQPDRSVVRFRIRANRGVGNETVSPRPDDPFVWHAYFVSPVRSASKPNYELFISAASLNTLSTNVTQSPRRVTTPDPPGFPRASWNATEPAVFVYNGLVRDIRVRHHGSRYSRTPGRMSMKWKFPRYARFEGRSGIFETDKRDYFIAGHALFEALGLPTSRLRHVNLYLNNNAVLDRLEQEENDDFMLDRYHDEQHAVDSDGSKEETGEIYKCEGVLPSEHDGPYGIGTFQPLPAIPPYWTVLQRYEWTYTLQDNGWKGAKPFKDMIERFWNARGDSVAAPNPNLPAVRAWLEENFDMDATLTYMAFREWGGAYDHISQNYFLWRRTNGKWALLPWDFDDEYYEPFINWSIYQGEVGDVNVTERGPNFLYDAIYKAFRQEYKQRLFVLNHTVLNPTNITALGLGSLASAGGGTMRTFANQRFPIVDQKLGLGLYYSPARPQNLSPSNGASVLPPATLQASAYSHSANPTRAHSSTTWFIRASDSTWLTPVLRLTSTNNLTSLPIPFQKLTFGQTYFWKCAFIDVDGHPSLESAETSFVFGTTAIAGPSIVLNEILADNRTAVVNGFSTPDYVELLNTTDVAQDAGGMSLSDDVTQPGRFIFPTNTLLPPHGHLVVWCDSDFISPGLHTGFGLDNDGQTVGLFVPAAGGRWQLANLVTYGLQAPDLAIGLIGGPTGTWQLTLPTPGAPNTAAPLAATDGIRINEWMATASSSPDWFELYNPASQPVALGGCFLSDDAANVTNTRLPALSFLGPRGFRQLLADQSPEAGAAHVDFKLSAGGETILLSNPNRVQIDRVTFGAQTLNVSQGRLPDGSETIAAFPGSASPEQANYLALSGIVVNEVLSHSQPPLQDEIELLNTGSAPVDISGWWLSDDANQLQKFRIPALPLLQPGQFAVFYESQFNGVAANVPFALNGSHGDEVFLSTADGSGALTGARTSASFGPAENGVSHGFIPTSTGGDFGALKFATFGGPNSGPRIGPVIFSEIQYHPPDLPGDDDDYKFIELANITSKPVPLFDPAFPTNCWRLRDAVSFLFPSNTTLQGRERVLVVGFDPETNAPVLAAFRATYNIGVDVRLFGPYHGKLDNSGASLELVKPDSPVTVPGPDLGYVPSILVERVHYRDSAPWPVAADGTGSSLQRRDPPGYGNEPTNWFSSGASAGRASHTNAAPTVALTSPVSGALLTVGAPVLLSAAASDSDGTVRRVEFFADGIKIGEDLTAPFSFAWQNAGPGPHALYVKAFDDGLGFVVSDSIVVTLTNRPPVVTLFSSLEGLTVVLPTNIWMEASAVDPDGSVQRVEFYAGSTLLGALTNAPYVFNWTNVPPGTHVLTARAVDNFLLAAVSAPVVVSATRNSYIAYVVAPGTIGGQDYGGGIGMDFNVLQKIVVTRLGIFDSRADGFSATLTAQIYNRNTASLVASMTFSPGSPGTLGPGTSSRFKALATPLVLAPGNYSMVGYGHNSIDRNGNAGIPEPKTWTTEDGGGLLSFVGVCRTGGSPGTYPTTPDTGPADRYASGTFEYVPFALPVILVQPVSTTVLVGQSAALNVVAGGSPPLTYRWLRDDVPISGQTNPVFSVANAQPAHAGNHTVIVTNLVGAVTSQVAVLTVSADTDGDGMPDDWEALYGLTIGANDSALDADGDGASNLAEYLAGTNPRDPQSVLRIDTIQLAEGGIATVLGFLARSNHTYSLLGRDTLTVPWQKLRDFPAAPLDRMCNATNYTVGRVTRFYRLSTPAVP